MLFRLISQRTVFREVSRYKAAGFIPTIVGHTLDGRFRTVARIEDVIFLDDPVS